MKAAIHDTFGEPIEVLKATEIDAPTPALAKFWSK